MLTPSKQTGKHKMADSGTSYIPDAVVPAHYLGFVQVKSLQWLPIG
jgi:hypothetical protein